MKLNGRVAKLEEVITPPKREADESQPKTPEEFIYWLFQCSVTHFKANGEVGRYINAHLVHDPVELCDLLNEAFTGKIYIPLHTDVVERALGYLDKNYIKLDTGPLYLVKYIGPYKEDYGQAICDAHALSDGLWCYRRQIQNPAWPVAVEQVEQLLLQLNAMPSLNPGYLFQKSNLI